MSRLSSLSIQLAVIGSRRPDEKIFDNNGNGCGSVGENDRQLRDNVTMDCLQREHRVYFVYGVVNAFRVPAPLFQSFV